MTLPVETLECHLRKQRDAEIQSKDDLVEAQARGLARVLQRVFAMIAEDLAEERLSTLKSRVRKARDSRLVQQAQRIIAQQTIEMFGQSAARAQQQTGLAPKLDLNNTAGGRDLLRRIELLQSKLGTSVERNADRVLAQVLEERGNKPRRQLAREYSERLQGSMTFDRALTWARTEAAVATNTGAAAAYEAAGIEEIEWMAFKFPIWPRRHDKLDGVRVQIGESFTMPESGARLRWPHDPLGPVGETVSCCCSHKPVRKRRSPTRTQPPPAPPAPAAAGAPPPAPLPRPGRPEMTPEQAGFDRELLLDAMRNAELRDVTERTPLVGGEEIRGQVRALMRQRGMEAREANRGIVMSGRLATEMRASAIYDHYTGEVTVSRDAVDSLRRVAAGQAAPGDDQSVRTMIHEEVHAHGASLRDTFHGRGVVVEEATTELTARQIASEQFGMDRRAGSYTGYIRQIETRVRRLAPKLDPNAVYDIVQGAAQRYKARVGADQPFSADATLDALALDIREEARDLGVNLDRVRLRQELDSLDPDQTR